MQSNTIDIQKAPLNKLLTAQEVASLLNVGLSTVYAYAQSNLIKAVFLPRTHASRAKKRNRQCVRFEMSAIEQFKIENTR